MKKCDKKINYSEKDMAVSFEQFIHLHSKNCDIGEFDIVATEVDCSHGRPDLIGIKNRQLYSLHMPIYPLGIADSQVLSILSLCPRHISLTDILSRCSYNKTTIKSAVSRMIHAGYITENHNQYSCSNDLMRFVSGEIWSFELKLHNTKRAIFQSQQSRSFAHWSMIVVPPGKDSPYIKYHESIDRSGIGLATFDLYTNTFRIVFPPRKTGATCRQNYIYSLFRACSNTRETAVALELPKMKTNKK